MFQYERFEIPIILFKIHIDREKYSFEPIDGRYPVNKAFNITSIDPLK